MPPRNGQGDRHKLYRCILILQEDFYGQPTVSAYSSHYYAQRDHRLYRETGTEHSVPNSPLFFVAYPLSDRTDQKMEYVQTHD